MGEVTQDVLREAQTRVKALQASRDQIIRDAGAQERKRDEAFEKLRELGIEAPEKMTSKDISALAEVKKSELAQKIADLNVQLAQGEELIKRYQTLQQEN